MRQVPIIGFLESEGFRVEKTKDRLTVSIDTTVNDNTVAISQNHGSQYSSYLVADLSTRDNPMMVGKKLCLLEVSHNEFLVGYPVQSLYGHGFDIIGRNRKLIAEDVNIISAVPFSGVRF